MKEHGFLPEESNLIDYRFAILSFKMEDVAKALRKIENLNETEDTLKIIREQISSVLKILKEQGDTFAEKKRESLLLEELWFNLEGSQWKDLLKMDRFTRRTLINFLIWKL